MKHGEGERPLRRLRNLGPASERMLHAAGIISETDLKQLGPVAAYNCVLRSLREGVSLNLLWALYGALEDCDWREIPSETKAQLKVALESNPRVRVVKSAKRKRDGMRRRFSSDR